MGRQMARAGDGLRIRLEPEERCTHPDGEAFMTRVTAGMTRYHGDGMTGCGLSEFLDRIVDGAPVGKRMGSRLWQE